MSRMRALRILLFVCVAVLPEEILAGHELLKPYEDGERQFEEIEIGEHMVVYYHQRKVGEATVEKDFIVYQFDKRTGELLAKKSHWRDDVTETLPAPLIGMDEAMARVGGAAQFAVLTIISPESDVFPLDPTPDVPCWIVRAVREEGLALVIVDAVDGSILGNGVPPPYTAFSLTGPWYTEPCSGSWYDWAANAELWFNTMGYVTQEVVWPTEDQVRGHVQSLETAMFYELAHGGYTSFMSGCIGGSAGEYTTAAEIETWITDYPKMPFAFVGSCGGLCETGHGTLSYAFRKGSAEETATVGYCGMAEAYCADCWSQSIDWQDALFSYMNQGYAVKDAFDQANADFPMCASSNCMRFAGDPEFAVVPVVPRDPAHVYVVAPDGSGDYPTIQAAIDAASDGDTIELMDGTFSGEGNRDISYQGKALTVRSRSGDPGACVIDCQGGVGEPHRGFHFQQHEGPTSVLHGVTITNGYANGGGGIACYMASPSIQGCVFSENAGGSAGGGGVLCTLSFPSFTGCVFYSNSAGEGGGIRSYFSQLVLTGCTFSENTAAVFNGGGVLCVSTSATLSHCVFSGNSAAAYGGGLCAHDGSPVLINCTFHGNAATLSGGGVACIEGSAVGLQNSVIAFCADGEGISCLTGGMATLSCCDVFGNADGDWVGCIADQNGVDGNFCADPLFCAPDWGDFSLAADSPCLPGNHPSGHDCDVIGSLGEGCEETIAVGAAAGRVAGPLVVSPNPSSGAVRFAYTEPRGAPASVSIFDVAGRRVRTFRPLAAVGVITWDGADASGRLVAPGVYFVRLRAGERCETRRILLY